MCDGIRVSAQPPSLHQNYPASSVLCSRPIPKQSFASVASSASRAYSIRHHWLSWSDQELLGLTGCLENLVCNANGSSTPGLSQRLAKMPLKVSPSGMQKPWAVSNRKTMISELNLIQGWTASPYLSSSLPFCVRFNQRLRREMSYTLTATLDTGPVANSYPGGILIR